MDVIERMGVVATGSGGPFKSEAPLKPIVDPEDRGADQRAGARADAAGCNAVDARIAAAGAVR